MRLDFLQKKVSSMHFRKMSPEEKVNLAVEMSSAVSRITLESIRRRRSKGSLEKTLEKARRRLYWSRRPR